MLTLGQAAKHTGLSKTTIAKAIASGRISANRTDTGNYSIDPAELFRVYPASSPVSGVSLQDKTPTVDPVDTRALQAEIDGLKAQLALMREHSDDIKAQRDSWQKQAESAQRLLADQRPQQRKWFGFAR